MDPQSELVEKIANLGKLDEEFSNFMHKVNEVGKIVKKLASKDPDVQKIGDQEAKHYLGEDKAADFEDADKVNVTVVSNRTVLNKKALLEDTCNNPNEMSKDAFMDQISRDAEKRYQDRLERTERMETFKKRANLAYKRGEYEKALVLYTKAIEQIKDSVLLYNNRALTYIKLGCFDKAKTDLKDWALRLNEDCLKSWLLLAKVSFLSGNHTEMEEYIAEAKKRNPKNVGFVEEYCRTNLTNQASV